MKNSYWIAGVLAVVLGAGVVGVANANQNGPCHKGGFGSHGSRGGPAPISFETLDADGDGKVTLEEIEAQKAARFKASDTDGDGLLSVEEMIAQSERRETERRVQRVKQMIERLDTDKDGKLSVDEIKAMGKEGRGAKGEEMFKRMDTNADGAISAEEYEAHKGQRMGHKGPRMGHGEHKGGPDGQGGHKGPRMGHDCQPAEK